MRAFSTVQTGSLRVLLRTLEVPRESNDGVLLLFKGAFPGVWRASLNYTQRYKSCFMLDLLETEYHSPQFAPVSGLVGLQYGTKRQLSHPQNIEQGK